MDLKNFSRGKGGVSLLWPSMWSSKTKKISEGNERIIAIELTGKNKLCIINGYLPTKNSSANSHIEHSECLDILDSIISKYKSSHKVVLCGDLNATLLSARSSNKHDHLLQNFVEEKMLSSLQT